jgi:hypothetical protein
MFERGNSFERGRSPLSFWIPLSSPEILCFERLNRLKRGYRGEVIAQQ